MSSLPPGMILILGALLVPWLRSREQRICLLALPILSAIHLMFFVSAGTVTFEFFGHTLTPVHVDKLSLVWGYVFHIAALLSVIYALHVDDPVQQVSGLIYAGSAIAAVFAGDLLTLFVFWELTAISSVFLIWASRTERSYRAGMRYLLLQVGSGVLLLAGVLLHLRDTGSLSFVSAFRLSLPEAEGLWVGINSLDTFLIFLAFGIKAAFPLLHTWVSDSYPEATPTGTVFLSAFTTKLAIYALARGFPGTGLLVWLGAAMTVFPLFFALVETDLRKVLAFSLNNQLGFMVVGVGLADFVHHPEIAELALNGTAAHAFAHILYKGLLFMCMGAVLMRVGTARSTQLGGLYHSMPLTAGFCLVGAASIAAFPFFSGFVTKSMILSALGESHQLICWLMLMFAASAAVLPDLKVPYLAFFGRDSGQRPAEAPLHMLIAMGSAAFLCVFVGIFPGVLYRILPFEVHYHAYTAAHIVTQLQLLLWSLLVFAGLSRLGLFPAERPAVLLDVDWFLRRPFVRIGKRTPIERLGLLWCAVTGGLRQRLISWARVPLRLLREQLDPDGLLPRTSSISAMVAWAAILLTAYLVLYYAYA